MEGDNTTSTYTSRGVNIGRSVVFILASALIIATNILNIVAITTSPRLKKAVTNHLLLNLSCADLLVVVSLLVNAVINLRGLDADDTLHSLFFLFLMKNLPLTVSFGESLYTLILIGIDRCVAVVKPLQYRDIITLTRLRVLIVAGWVSFGCLNTFLFVFYGLRLSEEELRANPAVRDIFPPVVYIMLVVGYVYVCLAVIAMLYLVVAVAMVRRARKIKTSTQHGSNSVTMMERRSKKAQRSITRLALILVGLLFISWLPYTVFSLLVSASDNLLLNVLDIVLLLLIYSASFLNPVLFAWRISDFRDVYRGLLKCNHV